MSEPEHFTDGTPCWCNPRVEHYAGGDVIIHNSAAEITAASALCSGCLFRQLPAGGGWCYMFDDMPIGDCLQKRED
jgi:hypothetical protein